MFPDSLPLSRPFRSKLFQTRHIPHERVCFVRLYEYAHAGLGLRLLHKPVEKPFKPLLCYHCSGPLVSCYSFPFAVASSMSTIDIQVLADVLMCTGALLYAPDNICETVVGRALLFTPV